MRKLSKLQIVILIILSFILINFNKSKTNSSVSTEKKQERCIKYLKSKGIDTTGLEWKMK